jgi:hypothetical protein
MRMLTIAAIGLFGLIPAPAQAASGVGGFGVGFAIGPAACTTDMCTLPVRDGGAGAEFQFADPGASSVQSVWVGPLVTGTVTFKRADCESGAPFQMTANLQMRDGTPLGLAFRVASGPALISSISADPFSATLEIPGALPTGGRGNSVRAPSARTPKLHVGAPGVSISAAFDGQGGGLLYHEQPSPPPPGPPSPPSVCPTRGATSWRLNMMVVGTIT